MQALYICLFNPSKRKDCKDEVFLIAQNLQKVEFEVVKCDKHLRLIFSIRDAFLYKVNS